MPLTPGNRLGPYVILSPLGAGGMGEVYKARDERLDRIVAVKVLPAHTADDAALRGRFEREARSIAALSDPHICTIHDVGRQSIGDGAPIDFIVMEYLEGETLADRLARAGGPLPIEQVLSIGATIAGALDRAHRAGIVHRDLKPANVMLTKSGPKLLDFGLAKFAIRSAAGAETAQALTDAHAIVGTIHYMAPELIEGRDADARSDIWALGAILYEMATGHRPFAGDSAASVMSGILRDTVPLVSARQPLAPSALDHLVDRCLQKDPDERWQNAGDLKRQLQWIANGRSGAQTPMLSAAPARPRRVAWWIPAACVIAGLGCGAAAMLLLRAAPPVQAAPRTALSIVPPPGVRAGTTFALSPNGRYYTFVGVSGDGPPRLWLRSLDETTARAIEGTEDSSYPFWSPESDAIGFFAAGKLKTTAVSGGVPRTIAPVANGRGGSWSADGTILFGGQNGPIWRVSIRGGPVTAATAIAPNSVVTGHRWPTFVNPRQFVYTVQGSAADTGIFLAMLGGSADAPDVRTVKKLNSLYSNTEFVDGRLLFVQDEMLVEQTLDLTAGALVGAPREIVGPVQYTTGLGYAPLSAAISHTIAYTEKSAAGAPSTLVWLDRQGKRLGLLGEDVGFGRDMTYNQRFSPDGHTVVLSAFRTATADLWLIDLARLAATRFTFSDANDQTAIFSPSGDEIVFGSNRTGPFNLYRKSLNGASDETRLLEASSSQYPDFWSPDGSTILYVNIDPKTLMDIWKVGRDGTNPAPVLAGPFNEYSARLTPDGKWLAYTSDESGRPEIYVQPYPNATRKYQISTQGGSEPMWRENGRELFYVAASQTLNVVSVQTTPEFSASRPTKLSDTVIDTSSGGPQTTHYAVTADGERFLANVAAANPVPPTIVTNWMSAAGPASAK